MSIPIFFVFKALRTSASTSTAATVRTTLVRVVIPSVGIPQIPTVYVSPVIAMYGMYEGNNTFCVELDGSTYGDHINDIITIFYSYGKSLRTTIHTIQMRIILRMTVM